jgi:hypothetical protein
MRFSSRNYIKQDIKHQPLGKNLGLYLGIRRLFHLKSISLHEMSTPSSATWKAFFSDLVEVIYNNYFSKSLYIGISYIYS